MKSLLVSHKTSTRKTILFQRIVIVPVPRFWWGPIKETRWRHLAQHLANKWWPASLWLLLNYTTWWDADYILAQNPTEEVWKSGMGSDNSSTISTTKDSVLSRSCRCLGTVGLCDVWKHNICDFFPLPHPFNPNQRSQPFDFRKKVEQSILKPLLPVFPSPPKILKNPFWN